MGTTTDNNKMISSSIFHFLPLLCMFVHLYTEACLSCRTPAGIVEASAKLFGDSWKLYKYCPDAPVLEARRVTLRCASC